MMTQDADKKRQQIQLFCMDDMVPQDHLLRQIEEAIDWSFIYDLVKERYCLDRCCRDWGFPFPSAAW